MKKAMIIFMSILLILCALVIEFFLSKKTSLLDMDFVGFLSGISIGIGISILVVTLFKKKL